MSNGLQATKASKRVSIRLENYMFRSDVGTYNEISNLISDGKVKINGVVQTNSNYKVNAGFDFVDANETVLNYRRYAYIMINKPVGLTSKAKDRHCKTVMDYLPNWCMRRGMKPANVVDKDMSGLVLVTDDLGCHHYVKSLEKTAEMVYHVQTNRPATIKDVDAFAVGMRMKHFAGTQATLSKADSYYMNEYAARVTTKKNGFYDIKKMFNVVEVGVLSIELIALGDLVLPVEIGIGQWRELNSDELNVLKILNPYL